jgi:chromosome partitioning protein
MFGCTILDAYDISISHSGAPAMTDDPLRPTSFEDFERFVGLYFQKAGCEVIMPPANTKGYDIELRLGDQCVAIQVKNQKLKCNVAQVEKFVNFMDSPAAERFTQGWFISGSGFGKPALTYAHTAKPDKLALGTYIQGNVFWDYPEEPSAFLARLTATPPEPPAPAPEPVRLMRYVGVFTCKGGVGKTTTAAHLAGAFALMGHDVILLDLDPDKNLRKLFLNDPTDPDEAASLFVPPALKTEPGATLTVLNHDEWNEAEYPDVKVVVCDCSPVLAENPKALIERFDYCIIPTTLNPLGVAKNADVITRTFSHIRALNAKAEMFCVINALDASKAVEKRNDKLIHHLQHHVQQYTARDARCHFVHPDAAKIRYSAALQYWGFHIIEGTRPQLAFKEVGGRNYPLADFLQLAGYLEEHTELEHLRTGASAA